MTVPGNQTNIQAGRSKAATRIVLNITRMTTHNGPGIRSLVLFKGCPLRCLWCSTPESQLPKPEIGVFASKCIKCGRCVPICHAGAISLTDSVLTVNRQKCDNCGDCAKVCYSEAIKVLGSPMTVEDLLTELKKDAIIYKHSGGGVTLSGGEPLLEPDFTEELVRALKKEGISVGIDTCGHVPWTNIQRVLPGVDFFLWDIKHMDPQTHAELTGVSNNFILSNVQAIAARNIPLYIRVPIIPGYNAQEENIRATSEFVKGLPSVVEVDLLPLHHLGKARYDSLGRTYHIAHVPLVPDDVMQDLKKIVEAYGLKCNIVA